MFYRKLNDIDCRVKGNFIKKIAFKFLVIYRQYYKRFRVILKKRKNMKRGFM